MFRCLLATVAFATFVAPASAKDKALDWIPAENQVRKYYSGKEAIESRLPTSIVRMFEPAPTNEDRAEFWLVVLNDTGQDVVIEPNSISAVTARGEVVPIVPHAQLAAEMRRAHKRKNLITSIQDAMVRAHAGNVPQKASGTISGTVDGQRFSGDVDLTYQDPVASAEDVRASEAFVLARQQEIALRQQQDQALLDQNIRPTELPNGEQMKTKITVEWPSSVRRSGREELLQFTVSVGADRHILSARLADAY